MQAQQAHELREARRRLDQLVGGGCVHRVPFAPFVAGSCSVLCR